MCIRDRISAPQKGWSASPAFGLVMLSAKASEAINNTQSTSFSCDLLKWLQIMQAYENGGHAYHATMPTDAIKHFRDTVKEIAEFGFNNACKKPHNINVRLAPCHKPAKSIVIKTLHDLLTGLFLFPPNFI